MWKNLTIFFRFIKLAIFMFSVQIPSKIMNFVFHQNAEFQSDFVWVPMMRCCHVDKAAEAATQDSSSCRQKSSQVCRSHIQSGTGV